MNPSDLPDDILHAIFRELNGITVTRCRQVCHRWEDAVDSLSDTNWGKICTQEANYQDYEEARYKFGLSWKDTYKSINSWKCIGFYKMLPGRLVCSDVQNCTVLFNGIVACLQCKRNELFYLDDIYSDTIVYYNTETLQECDRDELIYPFLPSHYFENEYMKIFFTRNGNIHIVIKESKQEFLVDSFLIPGLDSPFRLWINDYTVIGKKVYFKNKSFLLCVSLLDDDNGTPIMKTEPLEAFSIRDWAFHESVIAFAIKDEWKTYVVILTDDRNNGNIHIHDNGELSLALKLPYDLDDIYLELHEFGFNWKTPAIYKWLQKHTCSNLNPVFCSRGNVYLTTSPCKKYIYIFYCAYSISGPEHLMEIFEGKPNRIVHIGELVPDDMILPDGDTISQLDIIETPTSHKILVKVESNNVFLLEFVPEEDTTNMKKKKFQEVFQ